MKKLINIRNSVIIVLCITIICMGIGYIALSVKLKKETDKTESFDVVFTDIEKISSVKGSEDDPISQAEIIEGGKEINMDFSLSSTHDEISYLVTIKNKGTLPAEIIDVMESPNYKNTTLKELIFPITITSSDIKGKVLFPGKEIQMKIVAYYNPSTEPVSRKTFNYKLGLISKSRD